MDVARSSARGAEGRSRPGPGSLAETHSQESAELAEVRAQLRELQQTIEAIRTGSVDSLIVGPTGQEQVYALATADPQTSVAGHGDRLQPRQFVRHGQRLPVLSAVF